MRKEVVGHPYCDCDVILEREKKPPTGRHLRVSKEKVHVELVRLPPFLFYSTCCVASSARLARPLYIFQKGRHHSKKKKKGSNIIAQASALFLSPPFLGDGNRLPNPLAMVISSSTAAAVVAIFDPQRRSDPIVS